MPEIREAIEAAFPEVEPQQDAPPVTQSAPPEQLAEPAAEPQPVAERPRDEHGRFAPKQEAAAQESKPVETQPAVEAPAPPKSGTARILPCAVPVAEVRTSTRR